VTHDYTDTELGLLIAVLVFAAFISCLTGLNSMLDLPRCPTEDLTI
jgi:hypothetical protein